MDRSPSTTNSKRALHGRKLLYQERVSEQPSSLLAPSYLSAQAISKISPTMNSVNCENVHIKQVEIQ